MNIPDHISRSLVFWVKNAYILLCGSGNLFDPGSGMEKFGSGINISEPQHCLNKRHLESSVSNPNPRGSVDLDPDPGQVPKKGKKLEHSML
jgi:hypothetical protein